jgi:hypothetical protein
MKIWIFVINPGGIDTQIFFAKVYFFSKIIEQKLCKINNFSSKISIAVFMKLIISILSRKIFLK